MKIHTYVLTSGNMMLLYDPGKHKEKIYKFVFWKQGERGILVTSNTEGRRHLVIADFTQQYDDIDVPDRDPDAVGECREGTIVSWNSVRFDISTSIEMQECIKDALQM